MLLCGSPAAAVVPDEVMVTRPWEKRTERKPSPSSDQLDAEAEPNASYTFFPEYRRLFFFPRGDEKLKVRNETP